MVGRSLVSRSSGGPGVVVVGLGAAVVVVGTGALVVVVGAGLAVVVGAGVSLLQAPRTSTATSKIAMMKNSPFFIDSPPVLFLFFALPERIALELSPFIISS